MEVTKEAELFEGLKNFFKKDVKIKKEMINIAPTEDLVDEESKIKYLDQMEDFLNDTSTELKLVLKQLNISADSEIDNFIKEKMEELAHSSANPSKFYENAISNMDPQFVEKVKGECIGYHFMPGDFQGMMTDVKTVNEMLHLIHSSIVNDDQLLKSMPLISKKTVINPETRKRFEEKGEEVPEGWGVDISLYGEDNEVAKELFEKFPEDTKAGIVDIIGLENRTLIMARDLGHALTIDIDTSTEKPFVQYFVPKICNKSMVEALPGIGKITPNGANGRFEIDSLQEVSDKIFNFMDKVPTDLDMEIFQTTPEKLENLDQIVTEDVSNMEENLEEQQTYGWFTEQDCEQLAKSERRTGKIKNVVQRLKNAVKNRNIDRDRTE